MLHSDNVAPIDLVFVVSLNNQLYLHNKRPKEPNKKFGPDDWSHVVVSEITEAVHQHVHLGVFHCVLPSET